MQCKLIRYLRFENVFLVLNPADKWMRRRPQLIKRRQHHNLNLIGFSLTSINVYSENDAHHNIVFDNF